MLGGRIVLKRGTKDEAEKPFWISYADLMTALMMLFLVTMSVALLAVTKTVSESEREEAEYKRDINLLLDKVASAIERYPGVSLDRERRVIDFKERARFDFRKHQLAQEQAKLLRAFVPEVVLAIARDELGRRWLRRIVVEGFTDNTGSYLVNLNLSLQRSQRVLCVLLATPSRDEYQMSNAELQQIRDLFLVGGYSYNSAKDSPEASRRIELRLEFFGIRDTRSPRENIPQGDIGKCALDPS